MVDPISVIAVASSAFGALKKGFAVARDLESMGSDLGRWAGAMADLDFAEKQNQKPPWYKALGGSIEADAMEIFAARSKANAMRTEMKNWISAVYGPSHWQSILEIEAQLRQQKRDHEFARIEKIQKITEWAAGIAIFMIITSAMIGFVWLFMRG